jgi:hypothetical protein
MQLVHTGTSTVLRILHGYVQSLKEKTQRLFKKLPTKIFFLESFLYNQLKQDDF